MCYSGLVGVGRDPHSWVEITFDGIPYVFDVETEMSYRLVNDYITSMYRKTYEEVAAWSYVRTPEEAAAASRKKIYRPSAGMNEALTEKFPLGL